MKGHSVNHICLYLPSLRGGGAERVMVRLANEFADRGYTVDLVLVQMKGEYVDDVSDDVNVFDLDARRFLAAVPPLVQYMSSSRPDVLMSTLDTANVAAIVAEKLSSVDSRIIIRISNTMSAKKKELSHPKHLVVHLAAKLTYPHSDHVIGVSEGVTQDVITQCGVDPGQATTIYNPVVDGSLLTAREETVDHPWFGTETGPVILGVGELSEQKGFDTLVRAFNQIDGHPESRLIILGQGDERDSLLQLAEELGVEQRIDLPGFVANPYAYMGKCDVFVLSSRWEGCPNVLIEALACGAPVVATDCPSGPREILKNGNVGSLVPVDDVDSMAREIANCLDEDSVGVCFEELPQSFGITEIADKYIKIMTDSIEPSLNTHFDSDRH
ncbi:glycosyltransferase [Natrarchaeobius oligotrophus]|nr:glycosyltransferase [Natrarchaeobius chitinivorans]